MPGAGELASWAGGELADFGAQMVLGDAFGLIGLGGATDDSAELDEINGKLDAISSTLDKVNTHLDEITSDLRSLAAQLDVSTKEVMANASEQSLRSAYGDIEAKFGARSSPSPESIFGLLQLPKGSDRASREAILEEARSFTSGPEVEGYWQLIRRVQTSLTVRAGLTDPLLTQWATFLIAEMSPKVADMASGTPKVDFDSYAEMYQSWFMEAVTHQIKAFTLIRLAAGKDAAAASKARARMLPTMQRECDLYLGGLERMAISVLRPAPSGPTLDTQKMAHVPRGCETAFLRADILCRCLVTTFESHPTINTAERVSGCYGRVLMRPSDVGTASPPVVPPQVYSCVALEPLVQGRVTAWPNSPIKVVDYPPGYATPTATAGPASEFQCVDWNVSDQPYAILSANTRSGLRFARYWWPLPFAGQWSLKGSVGEFPRRQEGTMGTLVQWINSKRSDAIVGYFDLANLKFMPANGDGSYGAGLKPNPDDRLPTVVSWLDCWSTVSTGPVYSASAGFGFDTTSYGGDSHFSAKQLACDTKLKHPLEASPAWQLSRVTNCPTTLGAPASPFIKITQTMQMAWENDLLWDGEWRGGSASNRLLLFTTSAQESGPLQLLLKGTLRYNRIRGEGHIWCNTFLTIVFDTEPSTTSQTLYNSDTIMDYRDQWAPADNTRDINMNNVDLGTLLPNRKYVLKFIASITAACDWDHGTFGKNNRFSGGHGQVLDTLEIRLNQLAVRRPANLGYKTIG